MPRERKTSYQNYLARRAQERKDIKHNRHNHRGYNRRRHEVKTINTIGQQSEADARVLLDDLKAQGLITRWKQTRRFSKEDKEGVDFLIKYRRMWIPLQVKSSLTGCWEHNLTSRVPCIWPAYKNAPGYLMRLLRHYVVIHTRHTITLTLKLSNDEEITMQVKLSMDEAYYLTEVFRAEISGTRYSVGAKEDVKLALNRLKNDGILWWDQDKDDDRMSGFRLSESGYGFVRYLLTYCKEPKRFFVNQCNKYGPVNWKRIVEELFDYQCTTKIPKNKIHLPSVEHMVFERTSYGWSPSHG